MQRIDSLFVNLSMCTPRSAKNFFLKNEITVNDIRITDRKFTINEDDVVRFNSEEIKVSENIYIALNKPAGFVSSHVSDSHKTIYSLIPEEIRRKTNGLKLHSAGRLDSETEGLILLTTDGFFSHFITTPENKIPKTYQVHLKKSIDTAEQAIYTQKTAEGVVLPAEKKYHEELSGKACLKWITNSDCEITVTEGKFHEVRRIFRALGNEVIHLKRISVGTLKLSELNIGTGEWKSIDKAELFKCYCS